MKCVYLLIESTSAIFFELINAVPEPPRQLFDAALVKTSGLSPIIYYQRGKADYVPRGGSRVRGQDGARDQVRGKSRITT